MKKILIVILILTTGCSYKVPPVKYREQELVYSQKFTNVKSIDVKLNTWNNISTVRVSFKDGTSETVENKFVKWESQQDIPRNYLSINYYKYPEQKIIVFNISKNNNQEWE